LVRAVFSCITNADAHSPHSSRGLGLLTYLCALLSVLHQPLQPTSTVARRSRQSPTPTHNLTVTSRLHCCDPAYSIDSDRLDREANQSWLLPYPHRNGLTSFRLLHYRLAPPLSIYSSQQPSLVGIALPSQHWPETDKSLHSSTWQVYRCLRRPMAVATSPLQAITQVLQQTPR
jgi:hypothetical protein